MRSDKNDRSSSIRLHPADLYTQLEAGLPRHLDIEKNEVEMFPLQEALRGERIIQAFAPKTGLSQRGADRFARDNFVVYYQDLWRRYHFALRIRSAID